MGAVQHLSEQSMECTASALASAAVRLRQTLWDVFEVTCRKGIFDDNGDLIAVSTEVKWQDTIKNLVVNTGLDDTLDKYFKGSAYTAAHYVGLTDGTPSFAAGDTMASHAGWVEVTAYDEAVRQTAVWGTVSSQSVSNTASKATFTISVNATTIGGMLLTTNNVKGGSTGILYGGGAFSAGDKTIDDDDILYVTVTAANAAP